MSDIVITYEELKKCDPDSYIMIDIRQESAVAYGGIPGSIQIPSTEMDKKREELPKEKKLVLYCMKGILSEEIAQTLRDEGYPAYSLQGGTISILLFGCRKKKKTKRIKKRKSNRVSAKSFIRNYFQDLQKPSIHTN